MVSLNEDILISPRVVMLAESKHESFRVTINSDHSIRFDHDDIPHIKLNQVLSKKNSVQIVLDQISKNWLGLEYDPNSNKGKNTFELRIFIDKTEGGSLTDISDIDNTKNKEFEVVFRTNWNVPSKGFDKYPVTIKGEFSMPAGVKWAKPEYNLVGKEKIVLISEKVDSYGQPFKVLINGKELEDYASGGENMNGTGISAMQYLKNGDNEITVQFPKQANKALLDDCRVSFLFQLYPELKLSEDAGFRDRDTMKRCFFEINYKTADFKQLKYPHTIKKKFNIDFDVEKMWKAIKSRK